MLKGKMIENPEVPGLEQNFPPPPIISNVEKSNENNVMPVSTPMLPVTVPSAPIPVPAPVINSFLVAPPLLPSGQPVPWWVPTDADTQETYSQWLGQSQESTFISSSLEKTKLKSVKRKCEGIDPVQDAERVASAQRELSALMKPLKCDLCNAVMNSTLQAKLHYDGKPHQKKVSMFLNQSVKKMKIDEGQDPSFTAEDWHTYCDTCKTWFTSQTDAAQHYAGKKHIRATTGVPKQKSPKKNSNQTPIDPTGRFGVGLTFQPEHQVIANIERLPSSLTAPTSPVISGFTSGAISYATALRCDLCGVSANRLEQLETHRRGARHQKMLRLNGVTHMASASSQIECSATTALTIDYSICRTPSGSYYCAPCNKSFSSENSFAQHIESKKHKTQVNPKSPTNQPPSNAKKKGQN